MKNMTVEDMTTIEIKASLYDQILALENINKIIRILESELAARPTPQDLPLDNVDDSQK